MSRYKEEKLMRVKNLNGTADRNPPSGYNSWKDFYISRRGRWPSTCACLYCRESADVGAHVKKVGSADNSWYIAPLCYRHNNQFGEELEVVGEWLEPLYK